MYVLFETTGINSKGADIEKFIGFYQDREEAADYVNSVHEGRTFTLMEQVMPIPFVE